MCHPIRRRRGDSGGEEHHHNHRGWFVRRLPGWRTANGGLVDEAVSGGPPELPRVAWAVNSPRSIADRSGSGLQQTPPKLQSTYRNWMLAELTLTKLND